MALEQARQVEACEEEADEGGGADFQGLVAQVGESAGVSHGGLRAGAAAVEGRGRDRDGEGRGQGGTIFAGLPCEVPQPGEDFSSVKIGWTRARGKSRLAPGSGRCRRLARGLRGVLPSQRRE